MRATKGTRKVPINLLELTESQWKGGIDMTKYIDLGTEIFVYDDIGTMNWSTMSTLFHEISHSMGFSHDYYGKSLAEIAQLTGEVESKVKNFSKVTFNIQNHLHGTEWIVHGEWDRNDANGNPFSGLHAPYRYHKHYYIEDLLSKKSSATGQIVVLEEVYKKAGHYYK